MIHHLSITAHNPQHVAQILAELLQGEAFPFPAANVPNSYVAVPLDSYGTTVDVHPFNTELLPGSGENGFQLKPNPDASIYTATHAAISVPTSEEQICEIAAREGWRSVKRSGFFDVIEVWLENRVLIELLPPTFADQYLAFMEPQALKRFLAAKGTVK
ncbi:hypothetical protein H6F76_18745 [Leptolyngbya sp. FACHB-321]|uniref:hypothetical protein n=1 Tax=Leptolyngbya sp. FACHB-321 TaxID=2692807 RepID=UPI0016878F18|nr:hypothetical protein [Leptolyngbya sp. FACHB-321]MBD2037017.1 hypothetical protein [Leptolyngbya sp. FACHB-321]